MTTPSAPHSPERRLALLREIRNGRDTLRAGPSAEAQAVLAAKLAEWRQLVKLHDIMLRTIYETTATREELQVAVAILSPSGLRFLEEHDPESGEPTEEG
jgi:hypothetical protein